MPISDLIIIGKWWAAWLAVTWAARPLIKKLFPEWMDQGYIWAKIAGAALLTWGMWLAGLLKISPVTPAALIVLLALIRLAGKFAPQNGGNTATKLIIAEELLFLGLLISWSWVKAHEPTINGLEKFMDYGFAQSILKSSSFPPADMWFAGSGINYYYFGHLTLAVMTRLSGLELGFSFNLMLATLFALTATGSAVIARELLRESPRIMRAGGTLISAFLVTLGGNLHTIYAFTRGYYGEETPPPFWSIWSNWSDPVSLVSGWKNYWYPNATRFIPYTIHEFPSYSFVVSDIHGHVLGIPWAMLGIGLLITWAARGRIPNKWEAIAFGMTTGAMLMTNALDGPIYLGLWMACLAWWVGKQKLRSQAIRQAGISMAMTFLTFGITIAPFLASFKPFVSGIAINCPPAMWANSKHGPFIFEGLEKCQKSPGWMLLILWGFFLYNGIKIWTWKEDRAEKNIWDMLRIWTVIGSGLILFAEFFYFKDIYPMHFRSNTMFKLGYQAFILMALASGWVIVRSLRSIKSHKWYVLGLIPLFILVAIYPIFAVNSYFNNLKTYQGIWGLEWIEKRYPDNWKAINWLKSHTKGAQPVILEANGDSYTDYNMISTFTGLPTVAGWTVHEWLWRGGYEPIAARGVEVREVYESGNEEIISRVVNKYDVKYIIISQQEREKYPQLAEAKLRSLYPLAAEFGPTVILNTH